MGVEHQGCSWIDHFLIHSNGQPSLLQGGSEVHNDWIMVSDHRPLWAEIHLPLGGTDATLFRPYEIQSLPRLDRTDLKQVDTFKKIVEKKVNRLADTLSPEELIEEIAKISVDVCTHKGNRKATFYNSTRYKDGWSPMIVA